MTKDDLRRVINGDGEALKNILGYKSAYNTNITGSNAYFYRCQKELEALIEQEILATICFNFSVAENHLTDLKIFLNVNCDDYIACR